MKFPIASLLLLRLSSVTSFRFPGIIRSSRISSGRPLAGHCDRATASIGVKIVLNDLISQINETNFEQIKTMLEDGFLEDENEEHNEPYCRIFYDTLPENCLEYKSYLEEKFKEKDVNPRSILLYPMVKILSTERWGWGRSGKNGLSKAIDFDLSVDTEELEGIEKYSIVFMLCQKG